MSDKRPRIVPEPDNYYEFCFSVEDYGDSLFELRELFLQTWVVLTGEQGGEVLHTVKFALRCADNVAVTVLVDVEPMDEETVSQPLLLVASFTEV